MTAAKKEAAPTPEKRSGLKVARPDGTDIAGPEELAPTPGHPNRYRVLPDVVVSLPDAPAYSQGDEFTYHFDPDEEWEHLTSGLLLLLPNRYEVIGDSKVIPALMELTPLEVLEVRNPQDEMVEPGGTFEAAIPVNREQQLIHHIRRIEEQ